MLITPDGSWCTSVCDHCIGGRVGCREAPGDGVRDEGAEYEGTCRCRDGAMMAASDGESYSGSGSRVYTSARGAAVSASTRRPKEGQSNGHRLAITSAMTCL